MLLLRVRYVSSQSPRLTIALLGPPFVERDAMPIAVDTRKAIALLAYLAITGQMHARDTLATLLWPEYDQDNSRASLRRTLSALKKGLREPSDGAWLQIERERIGLKRAPGVWIDVAVLRERLAEVDAHGHISTEACPRCIHPLEEAVQLYRGDFLAGFTLRESASFDDWQLFEADAFRRQLAGALERLVAALAAQCGFEQAIVHARRWLSLDPLHELAHRRLMLLHAGAGDRGAALRQYRECVKVLEEELGVPPLAETSQLAEAIREDRAPPPPPQASTPLSSRHDAMLEVALPQASPRLAAATLPLVGRATEWAALVETFEQVQATASGHCVVLEGEAGVGKTRLAEEFLAYVRSSGARTVVGRCYEGEAGLAYAPFMEALRAAVARPEMAARVGQASDQWLSEAARLLPELLSAGPHTGVPPQPALGSMGAQTRFFEGVSRVLEAVVGAGGVLSLDDLHWADEASLDLLTYLVRRLETRPLCVVVTWRSERVPADHRLRRLLADAARAGAATGLSLRRLQPEQVVELLRAASQTAAAVPETVAGPLYDETQGLPFFVVEYLREMQTQGTHELPRSLPGGVRALLRSRLAAVSETGAQVLTAAAAIGRPAEFDTLRDASGRAEEEAVSGVEELLARGLLREVAGSDPWGGAAGVAFEFTHERLRELVYEETSLVRRRLLHRRVAEALRGHGRDHAARAGDTLAAQIAQHYQIAGQDAEAAEYFKLAGEHARSLYANAQALAHFRAALALGHPDTATLHEVIGDLLTLGGDYAAAGASYDLAAALREREPAPLAAVEHKLANLACRRGEWNLAESHFEAAHAALGGNGSAAGEAARLYADWSLVAHRRGLPTRAMELARRALAKAETAGDARALAQAHNSLGILASSRSELDQARAHLQQSLAAAERVNDPVAKVAALNNLALAEQRGGDTEGAIGLVEAALALCVVQGDRHREAALHNNLADLLHAAGRGEDAMLHLKQAVAIFAEVGSHVGTAEPSAEIWKLTEW
jgi:DNA-binding SARP family transcriptional activator/tetratricopeptide (TPR) repeat protein